jgi:4-hydroxybenzoate polyprenyltransferase
MKTVVALARCSHFAPTVAVTTFALLLAVSAGRGGDAVLVAAAVLAGQLSVGWSNDWLDRHRDRRTGRSDKPLVRGDISDDVVLRAAVAAVAVCVVLSLLWGVPAGAAHLTAVALAWSYNLGVKGTVASPAPYALAFGLLPAFVTLGASPGVWPPAWAWAAGALLGGGAHFVNTLPDMDDDAATGVRGLPHRLGPTPSLVIASLLLAGGALAVALGPPGDAGAAQIVALGVSLSGVAAVALAGATGRLRLAFPLTLLTAGAVVAAFVAAGAQLTP